MNRLILSTAIDEVPNAQNQEANTITDAAAPVAPIAPPGPA